MKMRVVCTGDNKKRRARRSWSCVHRGIKAERDDRACTEKAKTVVGTDTTTNDRSTYPRATAEAACGANDRGQLVYRPGSTARAGATEV